MHPIDTPVYAGQRNRLHGIIQGTEYYHDPEEPDATKRCGKTYHVRVGNPCVEGFLTPDLHQISTVRVRDLF
ncbi:MAG: hypothetical protein PHI12_08690 [Dehalococcoidales bacterium]|nr:hypothetical protein [Dehalococcoidales bacterium]